MRDLLGGIIPSLTEEATMNPMDARTEQSEKRPSLDHDDYDVEGGGTLGDPTPPSFAMGPAHSAKRFEDQLGDDN